MATLLLALIDENRPPEHSVAREDPWAVPPVPADALLVTRFGRQRLANASAGSSVKHSGLDFAAPAGAPVSAVRAGKVALVVRDEDDVEGFVGYGNVVVLYHEDEDLWCFYGHLGEILVVADMEITAGQTIGRVGNTTNRLDAEMLPRLHFELRGQTEAGGPPFPGPKMINCRDPEEWLVSWEIIYDEHGVLKVGAAHPARFTSSCALEEYDFLTPTPFPTKLR